MTVAKGRKDPSAMTWDHNVAAAERALGQLRLLGPGLLTEARMARRERGWPVSNEGAGVSGGSVARPTEAAALAPEPAREALLFADRAMGLLIEAAARFDGLKPATPVRGRVNTMDVCTLCGLPAPVVHRIGGAVMVNGTVHDGAVLHASTCYYVVWREQRKMRDVVWQEQRKMRAS